MEENLELEGPLFLQIKQKIEDMIVDQTLAPGDQIPSSTQLVKFYKVNHVTVLKGVHLLVDEGLIYKKRGVGMFVAENARKELLKKRRRQLAHRYVEPLLDEAAKLGFSLEELIELLKNVQAENRSETQFDVKQFDVKSEDEYDGN